MLKNITYKHKFIGLLVIAIICFILLYQYQIKQVFAMKTELDNFDASTTEQLFFQSSILSQRINEIDEFLLNDSIKTGIQQQIIDDVKATNENFKSQLVVNQVSDVFYYSTFDHLASMFFIELEGSYLEIVKTIDYLEKQINYAKIISVDIYTKTNFNNRKNTLYAKLYVQSIAKI